MSVLKDIKNFTILTGKISEVHTESLLKFPFIALENLDTVELKYDLDTQEKIIAPSSKTFIVRYDIQTKKKKSVGNKARSAKNRLSDVSKWVKALLWDDVEVEFYINGKKR